MSLNTVSILDGNSFVVSDRRGDIDASPIDTQGLFLDDTRFLSRWILTVNGIRPSVLSVDEQEYFQVQFFEAVTTSTIYVDSHLSVARKRAVGKGFHEEILVENHDKQAMDLDIQVDAAADFADLFEVKDKLQKKGELYTKATSDRLTLGYKRDRFVRETYISANQKGQVDEKGFHFKVHLPPRTSWTVSLDVQASNRATGDADRRSKADVDAWVQSAPRLVCSWDPLHLIYKRSLVDLAALRFRTGLTGGALPAAGSPGSWPCSAATA